MKAFVDDMIVKSIRFEQHLQDLQELFLILYKYQMKLNPTKCMFPIRGGKFLVFLVRAKG